MNEANQQIYEGEISSITSFFSINLAKNLRYRDLLFMFVNIDSVSFNNQTLLSSIYYLLQHFKYIFKFIVIFGKITSIYNDFTIQISFFLSSITILNFSYKALPKSSISIKNAYADKYCVSYHLYNESGESLFFFPQGIDKIYLEKKLKNLFCAFPEHTFQLETFIHSLFFVQNKENADLIKRDIITFTMVDGEREAGANLFREHGFTIPYFKWKLL